MAKKVIEITADIGDALKDIKTLFSTMVEEEKKAQKQTAETTKAVKGIGKASKSTEKGVKSISKGFKGMGLAMKAAGIGLIISAFQGLKDIMSQNQRVVDIFSTAFETASIVINQVVDALFNTYDAISKNTENFDALKNVLKNLLTIGLTPLKISFNSIKLAILQSQLAWENSFFGDKDQNNIKQLNKDILETKETLSVTVSSAIEAGKGLIEAGKEIANIAATGIDELSKVSIKAAYKQSNALIESRKQAEINEALIEKSIFKNQLLAEEQRKIRDDETKSFEARKKANKELGRILEQQQKDELKLAQARLNSANLELSISKDSTEAKVAVINAEKELFDIKERISGFESEQLQNKNSLNKEEQNAINSKLESESKLSIERQRFNAEQIEDEVLKLETLKLINEQEAEQEALRLQAIIDSANAETQAKIDAEIALAQFQEQNRQTTIELEQKIEDQRIAIKQKSLDDETAIMEARKGLENELVNASLGAVNALGNIFEQGTAASKAAALSEIVIKSGLGFVQGLDIAQKSAASTGPAAAFAFPIFYATQIAAVLSSVNKASSILSTVKGGGGLGSRPSAPQAASVSGASAQQPSFNIVGQSSTDQLAQAISGQQNQPIKTYVVSEDISTAQQLDRNIIEGAAI